MSHPSNFIPKSIYVLDSVSSVQTVTTTGSFFAISCLVGATISVIGDIHTGVEQSGEFPEVNTAVSMTLTAGQTIFGDFTSVATDNSGAVIVYK